METIWKEIIGYENYLISSDGRIKSKKYNAEMKPTISNGYLRIGLHKNGKQTTYAVHRLVAIAFIDNPKDYKQVNHKNGIRDDNKVENLEWCDNSINQLHRIHILKRRNLRGEEKMETILTENQVKLIPTLLLSKTCTEIAKEYKVGKTTITEIVKGRSWKYLNLEFPKLSVKKRNGNTVVPYIYTTKEGKYRWSVTLQVNKKRKTFAKQPFNTIKEAIDDLNQNGPFKTDLIQGNPNVKTRAILSEALMGTCRD